MRNIDKRAQKELYAKVEKQAHSLRGNPCEYQVVTGLCPVNVIEMHAHKILALLDELEAAEKRIAELESRTVTVKLPEDRADSDVSSRNQPGMVVAVHIDAGDFVKFKGKVFEVEETDFDDHDVTLWFVCGEVLQCAAGCQLEVVAAPAAAGIQVIEGEGQ